MKLSNLEIRKENSILKGFGIEIDIEKAHIKEHTRKTKSGVLSNVKAYDDKRQKKQDESSNNKKQKTETTSNVNKLFEIIRNANKESGSDESHVLYGSGTFNKNEVDIKDYKGIKFYAAQAEISNDGNEIKITFSKPNERADVSFSTYTKERKEDRKSFEKYGGRILIMEPLTEKIAKEILKKYKLNSSNK
jgi:hypothetical protein